MGVFDMKIQKEEDINEAQRKAAEIYDSQIKSLGSIMNTDGYSEIKAYFERERESAKEELTIAKPDQIISLQEKYKLSNGFISFLNNFEKKLKK